LLGNAFAYNAPFLLWQVSTWYTSKIVPVSSAMKVCYFNRKTGFFINMFGKKLYWYHFLVTFMYHFAGLVFILAEQPRLHAASFAVEVLQFWQDEKTQNLHFGIEEQACVAFLDKEDNFELIQRNPLYYVVRAKGYDESSALLIVECAKLQKAYRLEFSNHSRYSFLRGWERDFIIKPPSYLGFGLSALGEGGIGDVYEATDYSFPLLGWSIRRSHNDFTQRSLTNDSINISHGYKDYALAYGFYENYLSTQTLKGNQVSVSVLGVSASSSRSYEDGMLSMQRYSVYLPSPLKLRFSYRESQSQGVEREWARSFFYTSEKVRNQSTLSYIRTETLDRAQDFTRVQIRNEFRYELSGRISPMQFLGGYCQQGPCRLNLLGAGAELRERFGTFSTRYTLLPHAVSATTRYRFAEYQQISFGLMQRLKPNPLVSRVKWMDDTSRDYLLDLSSLIHLEYRWQKVFVSLDHTVPLMQKGDAEKAYAQLGIQYDNRFDRELRAFLNYPYDQSKRSWVAGLELRYFFLPNTLSASHYLKDHTLSGSVVSNFAAMPIEGAQVDLIKEDKVVFSTLSDAQGRYSFSSIPKSGDLKLVVKYKSFQAEKVLSKKLDHYSNEESIQLQTHQDIDVRIIDDLDHSGHLSPADRRIKQVNYIQEIGEAIVSHPEASYVGNKIWIERNSIYKLVFAEELLPFGYRVILTQGLEVDLREKGEEPPRVLILVTKL
jgi:hypothetical protein